MSIETPEQEQDQGQRVEIRRVRDARELAAAMRVRRQVFCEEQGVSVRDEVDGRDPEGLHLVATIDGTVVATCRIVFVGSSAQFSRLAVTKEHRHKGIATMLLERTDAESRSAKAKRIVLHAQTYALPLYEATGYKSNGSVFFDSGIEHIAMEKRLG
ncbi:MAG: GNAT family N-acetyltransferase [Solirubrobacterales bacterium]|nr:GNAT family N-acetyltransferase [Solirubrobacterales bacterium]